MDYRHSLRLPSSICYQGYFANYPLVPLEPLPHLEHVPLSETFDSRADWSLISVVLQVDWTDEQYSSHDLA